MQHVDHGTGAGGQTSVRPLGELTSAGLPALYQAADRAAQRGQRAHVRLVRVELLLLLAGAALGSLAAFYPGVAAGLPLLAAVSFLAAALLKIVGRDRRYDRQWFDGRAVAETVKSAAWRYMMRVPPFDDDATADGALAGQLRTALEARAHLHASLAAVPAGSSQISDEMRAVRGAATPHRRDQYRRVRLGDQVEWYRRKSLSHAQRAERYFWLSFAIVVAALAVAAIGTAVPEVSRLNLLGLLAALATAATALSQLHRHDELSKAYGMAFQELSLIDGLAERAESEADLRRFVEDAEGAISREHTMWVTRAG